MSEPLPFRNFLIVRNPASTNAQAVSRRIKELQRAFPDHGYWIIETKPGGRDSNTDLLRPYSDKLGPDTLLCIAGGDGTVNIVLDNLLNNSGLGEEARQTPLLPLWGGNANDLAHMLNGRARQAGLPMLLRKGTITSVFPLKCTLTDVKGQSIVRLAACYTSFGASALTTQVLGTIDRPRTVLSRMSIFRFLEELLIVIPTMSRAATFAMDESGQHKTVYEYVFFNGPRFAKVSGVKRQLTEQSFHKALVERKRLSEVVVSAITLMRSKQASKLKTTQAAFTVLEATWAQFDGEAQRLEAGTHVEISIAEQPFYVLTSRLSSSH